MAVNPKRAKEAGNRGETEFLNHLNNYLKLANCPQRFVKNRNQAAEGGFDLKCEDDDSFVFEVKTQAKVNSAQWWKDVQTKWSQLSSDKQASTPVLGYKVPYSRTAPLIMVPAEAVTTQGGEYEFESTHFRDVMTMTLDVFVQYVFKRHCG